MIISSWITNLISKSNAVFDDVSTDEIREYLNDALVLHRNYIRNRAKADYNKSGTLTFLTDSNEVTLPSDMDDSVQCLVKTEKYSHNPITQLNYQVDRGALIFYAEQKAGDIYYVEYTANVNSYDANTDDCIELDYPDIKMLLEKEVTKSAIKVEDDFESSNAVNNLAEDANNVQRK